MTHPEQDFGLIESLLWQGSFERLDRHLARLAASASALGFTVARDRIERLLETGTRQLPPDQPYKIRIVFERSGEMWLGSQPVAERGEERVMLAATLLDPADRLSRHKTTRRTVYDRAAAYAARHGLADLIFLNRRQELAEAGSSNVFLQFGDELLTPHVAAGILPGVYRQHLLDTRSDVHEAVLTLPDLLQADAVYLSNSVRGLRRVALIPGVARLVPHPAAPEPRQVP